MIRTLLVAIATMPFSLSFATVSPAQAEESKPVFTDDVIAKVGDQPITFNELNTMLNSSAIVGVSIPELGSPARDKVRLTLLDKVISANLIYLDALAKGLDKNPTYQRDLKRFSDAMLGSLYQQGHLIGQIDVTDEDVQAFFENNIAPGTKFTDEVKVSIESKLRKEKFSQNTASQRERLRKGIPVDINVTELDPEEDEVRDDVEVVAEWDGEAITWGEVKQTMSSPVHAISVERRTKVLDEIIDNRIMARKGREAGLEQDRRYQVPFNEFKKVRLINIHRASLVKGFDPSDKEIRDYYANNRDRIQVPAQRKVQIVVLESKEDAEAVKEMVEAGTITMYQAAAEHSILPGAKQTLGEVGWVTEGTGFSELDELTFSLGPDEIGGPVETPNGWHLIKVMDMEEAVYDDIEEQGTQRRVRRMLLKERLDEYVVGLRQKSFPVEVYDDKLSYHMQKEIDWYKIKTETGTQPPEKLYEEIDMLRGGRAPSIGP